MKKRTMLVLSTLLLILPILFSLPGCGGKDKEPKGDSDTVNISILFPGYTIEDKYKYRDEVLQAINKKLYQDLGFKINVTATSYIDQYETMLALDMANKMSYDFIRTSNGVAAGYAEKGIFLDLRPYIDKYAPELWDLIPKAAWAECTLNGKIYGIPTCSFPISAGLWFRGDWLAKLNKTMPTSLAELEEYCQSILDSKTINPNGKVIPMAGHKDFFDFVFLGMFTEHPGDHLDENGKIVPKQLDPGYRKYIEKLAEWYKKGYINDLVVNGDENTVNNLISKDLVGIHIGNVYQLEYSTLNSYNTQKNLNMQWSAPFAKDTKAYYSSGFGSDIVSFPSTGKNPEKAFQYFTWYYNNEENSNMVLYGLENKTYEKSKDEATGKDILTVPQAEITDTIKTFNDLMGFFGFNVHTSLQLKNTFGTRPTQSALAYDSCNTQEIMNKAHLDITKYFQTTLPTDLSTKHADSRALLNDTTVDMITGKVASTDATWAKLKADWIKLGGQEVYDYFTTLYEQNKSTLSFLQK